MSRTERRHPIRKGPQTGPHVFTLIELLIVIAIIAILAAILFPALSKAKAIAYRASCASNQKQLAIGAFNYMNDYEEWLPAISNRQNMPDPNTYSIALNAGSSQNAEIYRTYWKPGIRSCTTLKGVQDTGNLLRWRYNSPAMSTIYATLFLGKRTTSDGKFVRTIRPGAAAYGSGPNRGILYSYNSWHWETKGTAPLFSDLNYWDTNNKTIITCHNGTRRPLTAWSANLWQAGAAPPSGSNSVWQDGHVEWNTWNYSLWATGSPGYCGGALYQETSVNTGMPGPVHTRFNDTERFYVWVKPATKRWK